MTVSLMSVPSLARSSKGIDSSSQSRSSFGTFVSMVAMICSWYFCSGVVKVLMFSTADASPPKTRDASVFVAELAAANVGEVAMANRLLGREDRAASGLPLL